MKKLQSVRVEESADEYQISVTKHTFDRMLRTARPGDAVALYFFYSYTSKWQNTKKVKATTGFCAKGLGWSKYRVIQAKKALLSLDLIRDIQRRSSDGTKITGWYVQVFHLVEGEAYPSKTYSVENLESENSDTNAS